MSVKARLEDGSIVELKKDCACVTHDGPCWLNYNDIIKKLNRPLVERAMQEFPNTSHGRMAQALAVHAAAVVEGQRLRELIWHMEHNKIVEIIRGEFDEQK